MLYFFYKDLCKIIESQLLKLSGWDSLLVFRNRPRGDRSGRKPLPSESDFASAAKKVVPPVSRKQSIQEPMVPKIEEPVVPQKAIVTVSQQSHPRYGEEGTIEADAPNHWEGFSSRAIAPWSITKY